MNSQKARQIFRKELEKSENEEGEEEIGRCSSPGKSLGGSNVQTKKEYN